MAYLLCVCKPSSLLTSPPSLGGYNLLQLRPHVWMNVISPQRCFLGRKVYQESQHMKGEGIQEKICLSSWGLYPLLLRKVPCNLPVICSANMMRPILVFLIRGFKWTFLVSVLVRNNVFCEWYIPQKKNRHSQCRFWTHFFLHLSKLRIMNTYFWNSKIKISNKTTNDEYIYKFLYIDIKQNYEWWIHI